MHISKAEQSVIKYNLEQYRLQQQREETQRVKNYAKLVQARSFEQIVAERVARNLRLDLYKGRHIDIEC